LEKRAKEDKEFKTSTISPIAGLNRLTASPDKKSFVIFKDGNFQLVEKKTNDSLISVFKEGEDWVWEVFDKEFVCKNKGRIIEAEEPLKGDLTCKDKKYSFL